MSTPNRTRCATALRWLRWVRVRGARSLVLALRPRLLARGHAGGAQFAFGRVQRTDRQGHEDRGHRRLDRRRAPDPALFVIVRPDLVVRIEGLEADISPVYRAASRCIGCTRAASRCARRRRNTPGPPPRRRLDSHRRSRCASRTVPQARSRTAPSPRSDKDVVLRDIVLRARGRRQSMEGREGRGRNAVGQRNAFGNGRRRRRPSTWMRAATFEGPVQNEKVRADATAKGTLKSIEVKARGRGRRRPRRRGRAVQPFAAAPLGSIAVDASDVDLSRFSDSMPRTRLAAQAKLAPNGDEVLAGPVAHRNAEPGAAGTRSDCPWCPRPTELGVSSARRRPHGARGRACRRGTVRGTVHAKASGAQADLQVADVDLADAARRAAGRRISREARHHGRPATRSSSTSRSSDPRFSVEATCGARGARLDVKSAQRARRWRHGERYRRRVASTVGANSAPRAGAATSILPRSRRAEGRHELHVRPRARGASAWRAM